MIRELIRRIPFYPNFAVRINFLLPYRNGAFELLDQPFASSEGGSAMRGGDRYDNAGLADLKLADTMNNPDI